MDTSIGRPARSVITIAVLAVLAIAVALPALGADPSPSPGPGGAPKPDKPPKAPSVEVTLAGQVAATSDAAGKLAYTLTSGGKTYRLDAGPAWFFGDAHPLKSYVGKTVTVKGSQRGGSDVIAVRSIDGTEIRAAGRPPWAGGWKRVGKLHPGWSQEKSDRWQARQGARFGGCWPPGQCRERTRGADEPAGSGD